MTWKELKDWLEHEGLEDGDTISEIVIGVNQAVDCERIYVEKVTIGEETSYQIGD